MLLLSASALNKMSEILLISKSNKPIILSNNKAGNNNNKQINNYSKLNLNKSSDFSISLEICPNRQLNMELLHKISPNFCSVTWHNNNNSQRLSKFVRYEEIPALALAKQLRSNRFDVLLHLAGRNLNKNIVGNILEEAKEIDVRNIFALQGDPSSLPSINNTETDGISKCDFPYAANLVEFIRSNYNDFFTIGVAGYPEMHPKSKNINQDLIYLRNKVRTGADFIITQILFNFETLENFCNNCKKFSINTPILPGIYITDSYKSLMNVSKLCHLNVPNDVMAVVTKNKLNPEVIRSYAVHQTSELIMKILTKSDRNLIKGVHLFSLNNFEIVQEVLLKIGMSSGSGGRIERPIICEEDS